MKKIVTIIQARTGSKRLPQKMLMEISGYKIIEWVIERVKLSEKSNEIVLATSNKKEDDILEKIAIEQEIKTFRGSENDLLNRYYECAKKYKADVIVRICADNPLISFKVIDWTIDNHLKNKAEFTFSGSNEITKWSDGFGCEIADFELLEKLENGNSNIEEREHVFEYIWNHKNDFKINYFVAPEKYQYPEIKLDIDYQKDYDFMKNFIETNNIKFDTKINEIINCWKRNGK
jgi:spore coat polysaccharide biosynthesis protein SpsF